MASIEKFIEKVTSARSLSPDFLSQDIWREPDEIPSFNDALEKIEKTVRKGGNILVWGDQDCDGISSAALLHLALTSAGAGIATYIPDRKKEGIGMNIGSLKREILRNKPDMVITVDCCSRDTEAAYFLRQSGIELVVTDHHEIPSSFLDGRTIVNCRREDSLYPFGGLSGSGIALKLALKFSQDPYLWILSSLGTISDRVPLLDENRTIVKRGFDALDKFRFESIDLLCSVQESPLPVSTDELKKIVISPLASDFSENGISSSFAYLTKKPEIIDAEAMVRRSREWMEAREIYFAKALKIKQYAGPYVFFHDMDAPRSILGSLASKLSVAEGKKVFAVGALDEEGFEIVEARAPRGDALTVLESNGRFFYSFGGHKKACGAKIKSEEVFGFFESLSQMPDIEKIEKRLRIDIMTDKSELNDEVLFALASFGPFGQDFPEISLEITDMLSSNPLEGKNIYLLNEKAKLREATPFDDIWKYD